MSLRYKKFANYLDVKNRGQNKKQKTKREWSFEIRIHSSDRNPNLQNVLITAALPRPRWNRNMIYLWRDLDKTTPSYKEKIEK